MKYYHPRYLFRTYEIMRRVKEGEHFLEIGPGNLGLAQDLLTKFRNGTLVDFNTTDVEQIYNELKDIDRQHLKLIIADFSQYEFSQKFDCIVACEVLEHIQHDKMFLQKINNLLANSGQIVLSVPARKKYWSKDDEIVGHYRRYEKLELYEKLIETGYSQIKIVAYGFPFQNLVRLARICLAGFQYNEKVKWDQKKQSQQSAFMLKNKPFTNLIGLILNKYTIYPFNLLASLFNDVDLAEGYIAFAIKAGL
jgi:ubiquinone/menaquinone biosynthesis C-methylase UbiE